MLRRTAQIWKPKPYMELSVKWLLSHGAAALWLDPGLGKTSVTLYSFEALRRARTGRRMLVIAPLHVCYDTWPGEIAKWRQFEHLTIEVLHGDHKEEALRRKADIYCINPEGLGWLTKKGRMALLDADILVLDESTKFKHTDTQRFRQLKPFLTHFRRRWELTGTPSPNGLMDIFGQIYILDLGHALGRYITKYRETYFDSGGFGEYDWELKEGAEEKIYAKVRPLALRISNEVLKLPKLVFNDVLVELPKEARKAYDEMEKMLITTLQDGTRISAANAAVAAGKCLQICNGSVYHVNDDFKRLSNMVHLAKVEAAEDLVEEMSGQPALLVYGYDQDRALLRKAFPKAPSVADVAVKKSRELFAAWNRKQIPLMIAQYSSIAHGLNLQGGGQHIIWFGVPWDLEVWLQLIARLWRQGSEFSHIFVHALLAKNTIDEVVRSTLKGKDRTQRALLDACKAALLTK